MHVYIIMNNDKGDFFDELPRLQQQPSTESAAAPLCAPVEIEFFVPVACVRDEKKKLLNLGGGVRK
jgi:hypothetical protein